MASEAIHSGRTVNRPGSQKHLAMQVRTWPTPTAQDAKNSTLPPSLAGRESIPGAVMRLWPTPTVSGNHNRKGASATNGDGLATVARMWPTTRASDSSRVPKRSTPNTIKRTASGRATLAEFVQERQDLTGVAPTPTPSLNETRPDGKLSVTFTEWLMGFPHGWTDLED
ncbi:hypothetical protein M1R55_02400 [Deinococcus sp. QL22]|nr:hypothetical protein [Deinococcus sp. QL22]UQN06794.1 hypothetical protein M1R55_02400 [Deinococcus sp. QL22]